MAPEKQLPYGSEFSTAESYVEELLRFSADSSLFQILCGGVHILDFFTIEPGHFQATLPQEWHEFLLSCDIMKLLDLLVRDDLDEAPLHINPKPPDSLLDYIRTIRKLSLGRTFSSKKDKLPKLPRLVAVGMNAKKVHEVTNFADYVQNLSEDIADQSQGAISHFVDFGSGQNYLGRALASEPYNRHVVAVEGRDNNVTAAKRLDVSSGLAIKPKVRRNKKVWDKIVEVCGRNAHDDPGALAKAIKEIAGDDAFDFRAAGELEAHIPAQQGKGFVQYVSGRLDSGDLSDVIEKIGREGASDQQKQDMKLMAVSIHSCGNLSHFGIRSLILNPSIKAVAIVGCCYNLMTEKLGPPTYKHVYLRPTLQAPNGRLVRESEKYDQQGFPMSQRFSTYRGDGVRLNITARMMACQAPVNWSQAESDNFFTRHFYRAVIQKIFLDRGVVGKVRHRPADAGEEEGPHDVSTNPVIIGSLRKSCYASLKTYIRGVVDKVATNSEYRQYAEMMQEKMGGITDEEIDWYEQKYLPRKKEVAVVWSLMAFSAVVVESLIVADRWTFLKEHDDVVEQAWVETVFDYKESPRNLVVVGIKK